ncbi:GNAT family N-acetyltransferase [Shewanella sp. JM162201]|uniref:GNAT family N-acetyltransferase n=1 Tax=Shewanella jiangmenensis TaxID=2837387 RepID=A0ABS5V2Q5_9GAMM|nr:GNAT family N-acetyltransferase [Shewanella jiangmenensis]
MEGAIVEDESADFAEAIKAQIAAFNAEHWDASKRRPLGLKSVDADGRLLGGISGRTFGNWCMIDYLWVDESCRGKGLGKALLAEAEALAKSRGCKALLLDTLDFQAPAFYLGRGYVEVWCQQDYPFDGGKRLYLVKAL